MTMTLFPETDELPEGFRYLPGFLPDADAERLLAELIQQLPWTVHEVRLFGRRIPSPRLVSWHGDPGTSYRYSGTVHQPQQWTPALSEVRQRLAALMATPFNSVLANMYRDGQDSMGWHADDEPELGTRPQLASVSLGAERPFDLRSKALPRQRRRLWLAHGSLLIMEGDSQALWQHQLPKSRRVAAVRVNLTFRQIRGV